MPNMLDFFKGPRQPQQPRGVSVYSAGPIGRPGTRPNIQQATPEQLSRAAAIYGMGAAIFAVLTVYIFIQGMWFTGLIMIVPTFCLAGFCWYYMKP